MDDPKEVEFDWHAGKAASNLRRHGVAFAQAATVFRDPLLQSMPDEDHSDVEDRRVTIGQSEDGRLLVVVHTIRHRDDQPLVRVISARAATPRERRDFETRAMAR